MTKGRDGMSVWTSSLRQEGGLLTGPVSSCSRSLLRHGRSGEMPMPGPDEPPVTTYRLPTTKVTAKALGASPRSAPTWARHA